MFTAAVAIRARSRRVGGHGFGAGRGRRALDHPASRATLGFEADLSIAMGDAFDEMPSWMMQLYDVDNATALAPAGACVDLRVTQVANELGEFTRCY
jgi:hypothetical protein